MCLFPFVIKLHVSSGLLCVANLAERQGYQPLPDDGEYCDYLTPGETDAAQGLDRPPSNISTRVPFNKAVMVCRIMKLCMCLGVGMTRLFGLCVEWILARLHIGTPFFRVALLHTTH